MNGIVILELVLALFALSLPLEAQGIPKGDASSEEAAVDDASPRHAVQGNPIPAGNPSPIEAARGVLERLIPEHAHAFTLEVIPRENGHDVFEIESFKDRANTNDREDHGYPKDPTGPIILRGSSGVALCSALNWYLKYCCRTDWSIWGRNTQLPDPLPAVQQKIRKVSPYRYRYFFNYCCFGYSLAWWDWPQWERMIDWMAMNGINMPLAVTGQEAVWQAVLRRLGLKEGQIRAFMAGPPYLPFGWMGCLDGWGGPLPQGWIDRHVALQRKILARERTLGMTPVLQGFTGHVPPALKQHIIDAKLPDSKHPDSQQPDSEHDEPEHPDTKPGDLKLHEIRWAEWNTAFVDPLDPRFKRIGKLFIEEQTRLFGTDHHYASDTFIEMTPPSNDPAFLTSMGKAIYGAMAEADPAAVWVMQGWIFYFNGRFWEPPQVEALLGSVGDDRMVVLDLFCEEAPMWKRTRAFCGKPWVFCIIQNFGNTTQLSGPLSRINTELHEARSSAEQGRLSGVGMIQEGLGCNPVVFDFMTEMAWRSEPVDLHTWIARYAERRYGRKHPDAEAAWRLLLESVYSGAHRASSLITQRPYFDPEKGVWNSSGVSYNRIKLAEAWECLIRCSDDFADLDSFRYDLVNVTRQALTNLSVVFHHRVIDAYLEKDREALAAAAGDFIGLIRDLDRLLATRQEFLLGRWLNDAKRWGENGDEARRFEWNARNVITLWGSRTSNLHDYARKEWSGLLEGFYLPRWELFFERLDQALESPDMKSDMRPDIPFDGRTFSEAVRKLEEAWTHGAEPYRDEPTGDSIGLARELFEKYHPAYDRLTHLAVGKPVTASAVYGNQVPEKAVDGIALDRNSGWWADPYPQWLKVDLEEPFRINGVHLFFYWDGQRYYRYSVEVSPDGERWTTVVDMEKNEKPATVRGALHRFEPVKARFVRVNMLFNSANTGIHLAEVMVLEAE